MRPADACQAPAYNAAMHDRTSPNKQRLGRCWTANEEAKATFMQLTVVAIRGCQVISSAQGVGALQGHGDW
eukprot:12923953-Prorocentrum_lima.AAC.1